MKGSRLNDKVKLKEHGKDSEWVTIVSMTREHVVVKRKDGKLWCMAYADLDRYKRNAEEEK